MTKRASKRPERSTGTLLREISRDRAKAAGMLGKPVQRAWKAQNKRALASKRACRERVDY